VQLHGALEELDGGVVLALLAEAIAQRQTRLHAVSAHLLHLVAQSAQRNLQFITRVNYFFKYIAFYSIDG
jgi:hypothetical protein